MSVVKKQFAVIGHPIGHTMSPFIHNRLFALSGRAAEYRVLDIPPENLFSECEKTLPKLDGFNITIPHKQAVIPFLFGLDKKAEDFSSVNTVRCENGQMIGYTTDGAGFTQSLRSGGVDFSAPGFSSLILGGGGVARVMAFELALASPSPKITICVRRKSLDKARLLAASHREFQVCAYEDLAPEAYNLIANGTSLGMFPHADAMPPISAEVFSACAARGGTVFDAVYNPRDTLLLRTAGEHGCRVIGGMDMLVWQAAAAHTIWYGAKFRAQDMQALSRDANEEMHRIFDLG